MGENREEEKEGRSSRWEIRGNVVLMMWLMLILFAFIWLLGGTALTTFGVTHVDASRAAVLQVSELVIAVIAAVLIGGESLSLGELAGGILIFAASLLEAFSTPSQASTLKEHRP